jgi:hypothetical protein
MKRINSIYGGVVDINKEKNFFEQYLQEFLVNDGAEVPADVGTGAAATEDSKNKRAARKAQRTYSNASRQLSSGIGRSIMSGIFWVLFIAVVLIIIKKA